LQAQHAEQFAGTGADLEKLPAAGLEVELPGQRVEREIGATLRIARGVVYSDDFRMRGPAAKVNMSGLADLNQESVQLRVKVIPKLSEGLAVAGALIGGPLAGIGALAAQKLLRDPFEEAISQEYMVTGAWQEPDVKRLSKSENPVSEP
jgi:uncharacterized protein YhdP